MNEAWGWLSIIVVALALAPVVFARAASVSDIIQKRRKKP